MFSIFPDRRKQGRVLLNFEFGQSHATGIEGVGYVFLVALMFLSVP